MPHLAMKPTFILDTTFDQLDFKETPLALGDYENCRFHNCDLSGLDLSEFNFVECTFFGCNLSLAKLHQTTFKDVVFQDCKILGLHFENCPKFGLSISVDQCNLNHCSFYRANLKKTVFKNTQLQETDFTECDLSGAVFDQCDLSKAMFENTILEKADFRTAYHYTIDPTINRIKKARFSLSGVVGLLAQYDIEITP